MINLVCERLKSESVILSEVDKFCIRSFGYAQDDNKVYCTVSLSVKAPSNNAVER